MGAFAAAAGSANIKTMAILQQHKACVFVMIGPWHRASCLLRYYQVPDRQKSDTLFRFSKRGRKPDFPAGYATPESRSGIRKFHVSSGRLPTGHRDSFRLGGIETLDRSAGCVCRVVIPTLG